MEGHRGLIVWFLMRRISSRALLPMTGLVGMILWPVRGDDRAYLDFVYTIWGWLCGY